VTLTAIGKKQKRPPKLAMQQAAVIKAPLAKQSLNSVIHTQKAIDAFEPIDSWYFWWMFIVSASLIWLERKFY
jgi:hypothetical protein